MAVPYKVCVDCADPHALAGFWAVALDYVVEDHAPLIRRLLDAGLVGADQTRTVDGRLAWVNAAGIRDPDAPVNPESGTGLGGRLLFQVVPEAKTGKNRMHLDLHVGPEHRAEGGEAVWGTPPRRPAQETRALSPSGRVAAWCGSSTARRCTHSSRNASTARGLQRSGSPPRACANSTHSPSPYPTASSLAPAARFSPDRRASGDSRNAPISSSGRGASAAGSASSGSRARRAPARYRLALSESAGGSSSARSVARRYALAAARTEAGASGACQVISSSSTPSWSSSAAAGAITTRSVTRPTVGSTRNTTACSGPPSGSSWYAKVATDPVWSPYRSPYAQPPVGRTVPSASPHGAASVRVPARIAATTRAGAESVAEAAVPRSVASASKAGPRSGSRAAYPPPSRVDSVNSASSAVGTRAMSRAPESTSSTSAGGSGDAGMSLPI